MTEQAIRALLDSAPETDPHEFATAFVRHVETTDRPMDVRTAFYRWARLGRI